MSQPMSQASSRASSRKKNAAARFHVIGTVPGETCGITSATYAARNEVAYIAGYFAHIPTHEREVRP